MKVVVNPTWRCQLKCAYCWLPHTRINRTAKEQSAEAWANALVKHVPSGSIIDFSGGEPLLLDSMSYLLLRLGHAGLRWAITTNAMETAVVQSLVEDRIPGCVVINVSAHAGNSKFRDNIAKLGAIYPVHVNHVVHEAAPDYPGADQLPFQDWGNVAALDDKIRQCNAGVNHWVADPNGDVWPCAVHMQLGYAPMGNLFRGFEPWLGEQMCNSGCSTCYRDTPGDWLIAMREIGVRGGKTEG